MNAKKNKSHPQYKKYNNEPQSGGLSLFLCFLKRVYDPLRVCNLDRRLNWIVIECGIDTQLRKLSWIGTASRRVGTRLRRSATHPRRDHAATANAINEASRKDIHAVIA